MGRGAWWTTIHGFSKSRTWLNTPTEHLGITESGSLEGQSELTTLAWTHFPPFSLFLCLMPNTHLRRFCRKSRNRTWINPLSWKTLILIKFPNLQSLLSILKKSTLNFHWKDWCWSWSFNTLTASCEELTNWKRPWCWERWKSKGEKGWQTMRRLDGRIVESMDMSLSKLREMVKDREARHVAVHAVAKSQTRPSDWMATTCKDHIWDEMKQRGGKTSPTETWL